MIILVNYLIIYYWLNYVIVENRWNVTIDCIFLSIYKNSIIFTNYLNDYKNIY